MQQFIQNFEGILDTYNKQLKEFSFTLDVYQTSTRDKDIDYKYANVHLKLLLENFIKYVDKFKKELSIEYQRNINKKTLIEIFLEKLMPNTQDNSIRSLLGDMHITKYHFCNMQ